MATPAQPQRPRPSLASSFFRKLHDSSPNSTQLIGLLTLLVSGSILLLLTGLTVTASTVLLIFFAPFVLLSSPLWLPAAALIFLVFAGLLSVVGFGVAALAAASWIYRYFRGFQPMGSDRIDYARSRISDTASHVKDYAKEYGGYWQGKVKDAAPGA